MFDWDKDYEQLVKTRPLPGTVPAVRQGPHSRWPGMLVLAVAGVLAAGYAGPKVVRHFGIGPDMVTADMSFDHMGANDRAAIDLQVLDPERALRFRDGLRRFSDTDLLFYARHARRDHASATDFMRPYMADAEALIGQELARRNL